MSDNDFNGGGGGVVVRRYWFDALFNEVSVVWGRHPKFSAPEYLERIAFHAFLTTFYDETLADIDNRRRCLYKYAAGPFATDEKDDPLNVNAHKLPIDSVIPKIIRNTATSYVEPPKRTWTINGEISDTITEVMNSIYKGSSADAKLVDAEGYTELCGGCAVRFYLDSGKKWQMQILPPDHFQCIHDGERITHFCYATARQTATGYKTIFCNWTPDLYFETDYSGTKESIPIKNDLGELTASTKELPNEYGVVPFVIMRSNGNVTGDIFGGSMFSAVESMLALNLQRFSEDNSSVFESWGQWTLINWDTTKRRIRLGPGRALVAEQVSTGEGQLAPPSADNVAPAASYVNLYNVRKERQRDLMRSESIPESIASDSATAPQSGYSRFIERAELHELRKYQKPMRIKFEHELTTLAVIVYNVEVATPSGFPLLPIDISVDTAFVEEIITSDPATEFANDVKQLIGGGLLPSKFASKWLSIEVSTEEDAVQVIEDNLLRIARIAGPLASSVGLPAPVVAVAVDPNATAPTASTEDLKATVGGSAQVLALQTGYSNGSISRDAAIANATIVFGFTVDQANLLFPASSPVVLTPDPASNPVPTTV